MKRCWIYCGVPLYATLKVMEMNRELLKEYAVQKDYEIVGFTSENVNETFVQSTGALDVLKAITEKKLDVLVIKKGILDHDDLTIQTFFEYAQEHGVTIEEVRLEEKGETENEKIITSYGRRKNVIKI